MARARRAGQPARRGRDGGENWRASAYAGSLLDKRAGTIQPLAYARGLASAAIARARAFSPRARSSAATRTAVAGSCARRTAPCRAKWVIVATNAYTVAPWSELRGELTAMPYFNFATPPLVPGSARRDSAGATRGLGHAPGAQLVSLRPPGPSGVWQRRRAARLGRRDPSRLGKPRDRQAVPTPWRDRVRERVVRHDRHDRRHLPHFHRLARNVVSISGYNGRGIAPGTVFGRALAELALGKIGEADLPLPISAPKAAWMRKRRRALLRTRRADRPFRRRADESGGASREKAPLRAFSPRAGKRLGCAA